ncbi:hypothetical protein D9M68_904440 [compost metagenome]
MALVLKTGKLAEGMTYRVRDGQSGAGMLAGWGEPKPAPRVVIDNHPGVTWWNALSEADRRFWLLASCSAVPADAWGYFQRVTEAPL